MADAARPTDEPSAAPHAPAAGDGMLAPVALGALALLVLNDHVLKARFPGVVTGKLSDFAGLVFFPLLLVALVEVAQRALGRFSRPSRRVLLVCVLATGAVFSLTKTWEPAGDLYRGALGVLQWPAYAAGALLRGAPLPPVRTVRHAVDPTDLIALPSLWVAYVIGRRRT
jgi:hypothetical protein